MYKECESCHTSVGEPGLADAILGQAECQNCGYLYEVDYYTRRIILEEKFGNDY